MKNRDDSHVLSYVEALTKVDSEGVHTAVREPKPFYGESVAPRGNEQFPKRML